ncbi:MAG: GNAT family N-acetyltransferase [Gaiellaceae bacterium]
MQIDLAPLDTAHTKRLRELHQQPGVTKWWGPMEPAFPFDEPESQRFAIVVDGEVAGLLQWGDDSYEETRHAYVDIFVGDDFAGRGIGTEAMREMTRVLREQHGYHRITLDPAVENVAAIRSYEKAGFRPVGTVRRSYREHESGEWRDELLMELVVEQ